MGLKLQQDIKLQQKLSPALIQVIRLLEVPCCDMNQRIDEELVENPALEIMPGAESSSDIDTYTDNEEFDNNEDLYNAGDHSYDMDDIDYGESDGGYTPKERIMGINVSGGISLGEHLKSQVYLTSMDKPDRHIAKFIVGSIDDDGYLRRDAQRLADDLYFKEGLDIPVEKVESIIREIQHFDPIGVGAKDLQECLLIQLKAQKKNAHSIAVEHAIILLENYFEDFSKRKTDFLRNKLGWTQEEMNDAVQEITHLNPKPGSAWQGTTYERNEIVVIPDFIVVNIEGEKGKEGSFEVMLNQRDMPSLKVSNDYCEMANRSTHNPSQSAKEKEALQFAKQKVDAAHTFIDAIKQRNETLLKVMRAIVRRQKEFFLDGDLASLHPMVLQEIASDTGFDSSTISRATNSKYVQTALGIYPLKIFFSERITTTEGEEVSTQKVKQVLLEIIDKENKTNPFTDMQLVKIMKEEGYPIARRTIAKYREMLHIPSARMRMEQK